MPNIQQHRLSLPKILTLGFGAIIVIGSLLLMLPLATRSGVTTNYSDALFTATSATCVTGLTTLNTAAHWSIFGQLVIMVLVEIGGLGFMTFSVLLFAMLRRQPNLTTRVLVKESLNLETLADVKTVTKYVISLSLAIQAIGVGLLMVDFVPRYGWLKGSYYSAFHSVMSFCNAGFDLFGNSLENFSNDPYLIFVLSVLIIAGGLGFLVWRDVLLWRKKHLISLHTKIALTTTTVLLVGATALFWLTENQFHQLKGTANGWARFMDTFFLAVAPRTAGLEVMPYAKLSMAGIVLTMVLMFIGGTSGSTAGGIKTTTVGILWLQSWAVLRGNEDVEFGHRRFTQNNVFRASMLIFIAAIIVVIAIMILAAVETVPKQFGIEYIVFEVLSAFGTAGMTMGLTPHLTLIGKIIIMALMFIGRVGIFTVMFTVLNSDHPQKRYRYVEEGVMIG